jgi:hypothetical protein
MIKQEVLVCVLKLTKCKLIRTGKLQRVAAVLYHESFGVKRKAILQLLIRETQSLNHTRVSKGINYLRHR